MPKLKFKTSTSGGSIPGNGTLQTGEPTFNLGDNKAYVGNTSGNPSKIIGTVAAQNSNAVSISGGAASVSSWSGSAAVSSTTLSGTSLGDIGASEGTSTTKAMSAAGAKTLIDDKLKTRFKGIYTFTASGTYTKSGPDVKTIHAVVCGGGGGARAYSECGGGGGYAERLIDATGITTVAVTVGGGGGGGVYFGFSGQGGTSSFGSYVSATGGYGSSNNGQHAGGHGGIGSGGNINTYGGMGGSHNNMDQYSPSNASGGIGGGTYFGGSTAAFRPDFSSGNPGPGAFGAGGVSVSPGHNGQGGRGGQIGVVIVYEYR